MILKMPLSLHIAAKAILQYDQRKTKSHIEPLCTLCRCMLVCRALKNCKVDTKWIRRDRPFDPMFFLGGKVLLYRPWPPIMIYDPKKIDIHQNDTILRSSFNTCALSGATQNIIAFSREKNLQIGQHPFYAARLVTEYEVSASEGLDFYSLEKWSSISSSALPGHHKVEPPKAYNQHGLD